MQTIDSFLNMTNSNYIPNIIKPDIVFNLSNGIGADIIYLPEAGNLSDFFSSQKLNNMVRTEQIIIHARETRKEQGEKLQRNGLIQAIN